MESLRRWVQQALVDAGDQPGVTSNEKARIRELERENRDLRDANEILKAASRFSSRGTRPPTPLIVEFIDAQRRCGHRILLVCKVLGGLGVVFTERAYRKARRRPASPRTVADAPVVEVLLVPAGPIR